MRDQPRRDGSRTEELLLAGVGTESALSFRMKRALLDKIGLMLEMLERAACTAFLGSPAMALVELPPIRVAPGRPPYRRRSAR
jgi:hypothetical protein